jgi:CheY-like chemotaxis protein
LDALMNVLLVEPVDDIADLESYHLQRLGFSVAHVVSAEAALEHLSRHWPVDLLMTEMVLPGISGGELVKRIRHEPRMSSLRVIVATRLDPEDVACDANWVLAKPFLRSDLKLAVTQAMGDAW